MSLINDGLSFFGKKRADDFQKSLGDVPNCLDHGRLKAAREKTLEIIKFCQKDGHLSNDRYGRLFVKACCYHDMSFARFGLKVNTLDHGKAWEMAQQNQWLEELLWIQQCQLDAAVLSGRSRRVTELKSSLSSHMEKSPTDLSNKPSLWVMLALDALNQGNLKQAKEWAEDGLQLSSQFNNTNCRVCAHHLLGRIAAEENPDEAVSQFEKAVHLGREHHVEQLIPALLHRAEFLIQRQEHDRARQDLDDVKRTLGSDFVDLTDSRYQAILLRLQAVLALKDNELPAAQDFTQQAVAWAAKEANPLEEGLAQLLLGRILSQQGNLEKATLAYEEAAGKFIMIDNQVYLKEVKEFQADLKKRMKVPSKTAKTAQGTLQEKSAKTNDVDEFIHLTISSLDLDMVLNNVADHIMKVTDADRGFIVLIDENGEFYSHVTKMKDKFDPRVSKILAHYSRAITDKVLQTKASVLMGDVQADNHLATSESIVELDIRSAICVPFKKKSGEIIGLIYIDRHSMINAFNEQDLALVESLANYAAIAVVNANAHYGMQKKLEATEAQLIQSEKMATMGLLAGGVAHEINTPLGAILLNAEMLMKELKEDFPQKSQLEVIKESTIRCKKIVEMLLNYSRKSDVILKEINLNQVIDKTCSFLEHQLSNDKICLTKQQQEIAPINGDFTKLMQVFTNLIINARDAIKSIKESGTITIKSYQKDGFVVAQIEDDGCGIPQENIGKIFDPFFTTKDVGKGTGLGLSIVYRIVESHQGTIIVSSEPQKGASLTITIPVKKMDSQNCWEIKKCGREPGGSNAEELGVCKAATEIRADGLNRGRNGGRACWAIAGTFCEGKVQGSYAQKVVACLQCPFYQMVRKEEGKGYAGTGAILAKVKDKPVQDVPNVGNGPTPSKD